MHKSTSSKQKGFKLYALTLSGIVSFGALAALVSGVTPANAANITQNPDTQVAIFMVPLTLLVLALLYEVARFAARGKLPAELPNRRNNQRHWNVGEGS